MVDYEIKVDVEAWANGDIKLTETDIVGDLVHQKSTWVINTREKAIRNALIALGWTPPEGDQP